MAFSPIARALTQRLVQSPCRVSTRELSRHTNAVLSGVKKGDSSAVITYRGIPSFLLTPIKHGDLLSALHAASPEMFDNEIHAAETALDAHDLHTLSELAQRSLAREA